MVRTLRHALPAALAVMLLAGTAQAEPLLAVTGVAANDVLNLHAVPDSKSPKTGTLPPDTKDIAVTAMDTKSLDWVMIRKGTTSGWVNAKFLAYASALPARLRCQGTEPFWSIDTGYGVAAVDFSDMGGGKARLTFSEPVPAMARATPWLLAFHDKGASFLVIEKQTCSDGMSDTNYPYSIAASVMGRFVGGCCR